MFAAFKMPDNLQDTMLRYLQEGRIPVTLFLINGVRLQGFVGGFDNYTIYITHEFRSQLVSKNFIATIVPDPTIAL